MTEALRAAERAESLVALLALPDPPELAGLRKYRYRYGGDKVQQPLIKRDLALAYITWRQREGLRHNDFSCVVSVRRYPQCTSLRSHRRTTSETMKATSP